MLACIVLLFCSCLFLLNFALEIFKFQCFLLYLLIFCFPLKWILRYYSSSRKHLSSLPCMPNIHCMAPVWIQEHFWFPKGMWFACHLNWKLKQKLWRRKRFLKAGLLCLRNRTCQGYTSSYGFGTFSIAWTTKIYHFS